MRYFLRVTLAVSLVSGIGCSSSTTLTRNKTKDLLHAFFEAHPEGYFDMGGTKMRPIRLMPQENEAGRKAGYWTLNSQGWVNLTPEGRNVFDPYGVFYYDLFALSKPRRARVIEVTGISDPPAIGGAPGTAKVLDATWSYDLSGLPPEIQTLFKNHWSQPFHALLKLYDDGWRVEAVEVSADELNSMK